MSWREGEQPTAAQADAAVGIFLHEMGLSRHQAVYALHRNTHNWHVHLAVNRVDPETEKVVTVNGRFDHEVAHRAIARIEQKQGWQREDRGLFVARSSGELERSQPRGQRGRHLPRYFGVFATCLRGQSRDRSLGRAYRANAAPSGKRRRADEGADSVALGYPDLAGLPHRRSRMRAL